MLQIFPLFFYLTFFSSLFLALDIIKKEVSHISIPLYLLVLVIYILLQRKQFKKVIFVAINLTVAFHLQKIKQLFYKLFHRKKVNEISNKE